MYTHQGCRLPVELTAYVDIFESFSHASHIGQPYDGPVRLAQHHDTFIFLSCVFLSDYTDAQFTAFGFDFSCRQIEAALSHRLSYSSQRQFVPPQGFF